MASIIVAMPKLEDAKGIKNLLVRNGFQVNGACHTGAQAINLADELNSGIVISGYKLSDMMYHELLDSLPEDFQMLLLANRSNLDDCSEKNLMALSMPLQLQDLLRTVEVMVAEIDRKRRRARLQPKVRNEADRTVIAQAKEVLMTQNGMTEEEAHRYIQKCSMDSGTNMVETAQKVLTLMKK